MNIALMARASFSLGGSPTTAVAHVGSPDLRRGGAAGGVIASLLGGRGRVDGKEEGSQCSGLS